MKMKKITEAEREARRFLKRCSELHTKIGTISDEEGGYLVSFGSKYTAAIKRASMDLTRALADLRKPNH